jgi:hypothetical protein
MSMNTSRDRIIRLALAITFPITTTGCGNILKTPEPKTAGEVLSGYTYIPIDPTKVQIKSDQCKISHSSFSATDANKINLLNVLPDNAVRMSMESTDSKGNVTYGVGKIGSINSSYKLTADYVNSDTVNKSIWIRKTMLLRYTEVSKDGATNEKIVREPVSFMEGASYKAMRDEKRAVSSMESIPGTEAFEARYYDEVGISFKERDDLKAEYFEAFNVPVYVGIGLRIIAEGRSLTGDASISGIGVVGAEAEAKRLVGSLTVQTLGVNSQAVASALPVQSELSRTTAENAFVAIGSIKAMLHQPETIKSPRVVGLYLPFPGGKPLVNALISELSRNPVNWCPNGYSKDN